MKNQRWTWRPLGELFQVGAGKTMSASARAGGDKVPFLRTSNVLWDEIDLTRVDEMSISPSELVGKSLKIGDLLVCEGGEIGRAAVWDGRVSVMSFQNHVHRLHSAQADVHPRFYVYFLQSAFTQLGIFEGAGNKTTIPNLSRNRLATLDVPWPPVVEQKSVAQTLSKVREAGSLQERATEAALELKNAVMKDLFTRGLRGESQKETDIGTMPESWNPQTIRQLCDIKSGGTPRKSVSMYWDGPIPWVSGKDLKRPALDDAIDHISLEGLHAGTYLAPTGSVLLLVRGMGLAKDLPVAVINRPMAFNQDIKALIPRGPFSGQFLRSAIYAGKERLLAQMVSSAHGTMTLNLNDVETFQIACPSDPDEAEEIANLLHGIDRKINLHQAKAVLLKELFQSLLYKLMTGEVAVSDLDLSALSSASVTSEGSTA